MNVLVIGGGGREHALCHAIAKSTLLDKLFILPGNAGTEQLGTNIAGDSTDVKFVLDVARRENIDLAVVGPEDPLAAGVVDALRAAGRRAFGPTAAAARLEADKAFAKQIMRQRSVPTAEARSFTEFEAAQQYLSTRDEPVVVKAAGLAKGKGVVVCDDPAEAILAAERMLVDGAFGAAGETIIVEERLIGREVSVMAIVDGHTLYVLEHAQDHKRLLDGDEGPNTGGMGAFSPTTSIDDALMQEIEGQVLVPTLDALLREGVAYQGMLYAGLMLTAAGPKVLEFNCRFGDPEAQVVLPRIRSDVLALLDLATRGQLAEADVEWDSRAALCVVLAASGYPNETRLGDSIYGLELPTADDVSIFHAGVAREDGRWVTAGGRVLGVTALGATLADARERAYTAVERVTFADVQYRRDIGVCDS